MKASHYEILNVPVDADADTIRRAWRQKIREVHSDFGGSPEENMEVQQAYEILSDPVKRAAYDAGTEHTEEESAEAAENVLKNMFEAAMEAGVANIPHAVKLLLDSQLPEFDRSLKDVGRRRRKLVRQWKGRVQRTDGGANVFDEIIEERLHVLAQEAYEKTFARNLNRRAVAMLDLYADEGKRADLEDDEEDDTLLIGGRS